MQRLPVNFTEMQYEFIRDEAHVKRKSMSDIVRKAVDEYAIRKKSEKLKKDENEAIS